MSHFDQAIGKEISFLPSTSVELLRNCGSKLAKRLRGENLNAESSNSAGHQQASSTVCIMKLAKEKLIHFNSQNADVISSVFSYVEAQQALGYQVPLDMVLAILLQAAAEKVGNQQYVDARKLLSICHQFACKKGDSATQRLAYYFVEALQEKADRECGISLPLEEMELEEPRNKPMDEKVAMIYLQPEIMAAQQENPFSLVAQFMAVGTIRDSVASAKKVHLIDLSLDNGSHWTLIMEDFAARHESPMKLLKITAVGTCRWMMEETGKRLSSFAEAINLPFSFNIVVSDLKDLRRDSFELADDEVVAVYAATRLWTLLAWPNYLEALIGTIKSLKPRVMVVKEMEASTNKTSFLERFDEALMFMSGVFDVGKDCMENQVQYRNVSEEFIFGKMIRNIITSEGARRIHRHERIPFWRSLFAKFDVVEANLSRSSFRRAKLLLKRSPRFGSFTLDVDGKCLILGWRGSPFISVSAWKFPKDS